MKLIRTGMESSSTDLIKVLRQVVDVSLECVRFTTYIYIFWWVNFYKY